MKVIKFTDQRGEAIGLCTSRCHNTPARRCRCSCNGKYHGKGHTEAMIKSNEEITGQVDLFNLEGTHHEIKTSDL